jgi:uncharacterized protein HemX
MAEEKKDAAEPKLKMKPETLSLSALVIALATGTGGLGLNLSSNKEVIAKIEALNLTMVEFKGAVKASDERTNRLEMRVEKLDDMVDKLRTENAELKHLVKVMEARVK